MIDFQRVTPEGLGLLKEITNSNPEFNVLSEGPSELTDREISEMYESSSAQGAVMVFVMAGDQPVGVVDYLMENPSDNMPWLGLLMIHADYQGQGHAVEALKKYETLMLEAGKTRVRLGVIKGNERALRFWINRGFTFYEEKQGDKWTVLCLEKEL